MDYTLLDLQTVLRRIHRGVVMYCHDGTGAPVRWDGLTQLPALAQLGDTQGDIVVNGNPTVANFQLEEISGDAVYEATYTGENPVIEIPLFLADPALFPIISPTGTAAAGHGRVQDVAERTIVLFPERLFKNPAGQGYGRVSYTDALGWQFSPPSGAGYGAAVALTAAQETLLALSVWFPRGYFTRPTRRFLGGHGNDAKNIETATFTAMMHPEMPDGQRLYWYGDPADWAIDIDPQS